MRIEKLELTNFRCFEQQEFEFGQRFNLLVGNNATGKTAILEAITVVLSEFLKELPEPARFAREIAERDIRHKFYLSGHTLTSELQHPTSINVSTNYGFWEVGFGQGYVPDFSVRRSAQRVSHAVQNGESIQLVLFSYYGTERLWVQSEQTSAKSLSPLSRFAGYQDCLKSASNQKRFLDWFKTQEFIALQQQRDLPTLEACRDAIRECVPGSTRVYFDVAYDQLVVEIEGKCVPFSMLSDGFRNMLAIVADIAVRCSMLNPQLEAAAPRETQGVVLIDELDLHLHPKWQRHVVGDLMRAFPKIQFIATSHSPFIIQSLPTIEGVKLINLDDAASHDVRDQSIEDIAETIQGVELPQRSQRHIDMMHKAEKYFAMLKDESKSTEAERAAARREIEAMDQFSDNPAYQAIIRMQELVSNKGNGAKTDSKGDAN
jgi:predicted ATP-binding protein involved in virulence